jgi:hypothetical protein
MKKVLSAVGISGVLYLLPLVTFAAVAGTGSTAGFSSLKDFFTNISTFINSTLVPFVFAIAFLVFIWGVFRYFIFGGGDETARKAGKDLMLYAIIGFLVMVSLWGIVNILANGLGLKGDIDTTILPVAPKPR